jgi:drug/metabolite transporter (DMT)-like permease
MLEILVVLASMVCSGMAVVLVKKGLDRLPPEPGKNVLRTSLTLLTNKWWFMGGALLLVGWLLRFIAIGLSDLSYVRMMYVSHLLIVIIGSKLLVKEKLTPSLVLSILVILSGLLFVTASPPLTRTEVGDIPRYTAFFIIMLVLLMVSLLFTILSARSKNFFYAISSACSFSLGAVTQGVFAVNLLDLQSLTSISFYISLLNQPLIYLMVIFSFFGFILGNLMAYHFKISLSYSIEYPLSEVFVLIGSVVIFNEDLSFATNPNRIIGIILLMVGLVVTVVTQKKYLIRPNLLAPSA